VIKLDNLLKDYIEESFDLYMIEEINAEANELTLANYIFDKTVTLRVSDDEIRFYSKAFDDALSHNMFLFVEYDEKRGVIIGRQKI